MEVISTNIGKVQTINWKNKEVKTGFYKIPVTESIYLAKYGVIGDKVVDTKVHGGSDKACYIFSEKHYDYWKNLYPDLDWQWGMFGENLTISNIDESEIRIGDIYKIGNVVVQVTQPRQPCYKLGIRFKTQNIVKQFVKYGYAGVYVRILTEGSVKIGDKMQLLEQNEKGMSLKEIFRLLYSKKEEQEIAKKAISDKLLAESCKKDLIKHFGL